MSTDPTPAPRPAPAASTAVATALAEQRVAVSGASGLVGRAVTRSLRLTGAAVVPISRTPAPGGITWPAGGRPFPPGVFDGVTAVIHLAGENIAGGRWTRQRMERIRRSRLDLTRTLATALAESSTPPDVLISASAIGAYGDRGDDLLTEDAPCADDFLGQLAREWEGAADPARAAGIRVVHPRFGIILSPAGGALARMLLPARLGLGGPLGSGTQWISWVTLPDVVAILERLLTDPAYQGAVNVVAPEAVRSATFARTLGQVLGRPAVIPVPATVLRLVFGAMADATLLASTRVSPTVLEQTGYRFLHPTLADGLRTVLRRT